MEITKKQRKALKNIADGKVWRGLSYFAPLGEDVHGANDDDLARLEEAGLVDYPALNPKAGIYKSFYALTDAGKVALARLDAKKQAHPCTPSLCHGPA